jgi:hypothetical protein
MDARRRERRIRDTLRAGERLVGWLVGVPFASWRYLSRDVEIHREERTCGWPLEGFPEEEADGLGVQSCARGTGPAFRRHYRVTVERPLVTAAQLMSVIAADPNVACPLEIARFEKTKGEAGEMHVGDEYRVRLPGPWNGPVRIIAQTETSFRLATLAGHMEAGQIEFRAADSRAGLLFEIESWARSGDTYFHVLYDRVGLTKELQLHMWAHFLERAAQISGGTPAGAVEILTDRCEEHPLE